MGSKFRLREGWSSFFLLNATLLTVAWSIQAAQWTEGLNRLPWAVLASVTIGSLLAKSRWSSPLTHFLSAFIGAAWAAFLTGTLLPAELSWRNRLIELAERLLTWFVKALTGGTSGDDLPFVLGLILLLWLLGHLCAWFAFRSRMIWGSGVLGGAALLFNLCWAPPHLSVYLGLYLFCASLLVARYTVYLQEREWQAARIGYKAGMAYYFLRDGVILALTFLLFAWSFPVPSVDGQVVALRERLESPWQLIQDHWTRLFPSLKHHPIQPPKAFDMVLNLDEPIQLSDEPVMDVWAEKRYYWRAAVYDQYTGRSWINTDRYLILLKANAPLVELPYQLRREIVQTVRVLQPEMNLIHAAPQPVRVDRPVWAVHTPSSPERAGSLKAFSMLAYSGDLAGEGTYTVVSSVSEASAERLRAAGSDYPAWVTDRYRQLPPTVPQRVRALARQITQGEDNAYDKATALEKYLRKFLYNESVEAPPQGRDGVDYFLFDSRQGYCNYYASAMAVMARAVGIPARLASGYTSGRDVAERGAYRVFGSDAHTWVEIYFPGYGWVDFEPTGIRSPIVRPEPENEVEEELQDEERGFGEEGRGEEPLGPGESASDAPSASIPPPWPGREGVAAFWAGGLILALLGGGLALWLQPWRKRRPLSQVERAYENMLRWANWLGLGLQPHQTPYEHAALLARAIPSARNAINHLVALYVRGRFRAGELDAAEREGARQAWRHLRPILRHQLLLQRLRLRRPPR